jgi:hypothetical protein
VGVRVSVVLMSFFDKGRGPWLNLHLRCCLESLRVGLLSQIGVYLWGVGSLFGGEEWPDSRDVIVVVGEEVGAVFCEAVEGSRDVLVMYALMISVWRSRVWGMSVIVEAMQCRILDFVRGILNLKIRFCAVVPGEGCRGAVKQCGTGWQVCVSVWLSGR